MFLSKNSVLPQKRERERSHKNISRDIFKSAPKPIHSKASDYQRERTLLSTIQQKSVHLPQASDSVPQLHTRYRIHDLLGASSHSFLSNQKEKKKLLQNLHRVFFSIKKIPNNVRTEQSMHARHNRASQRREKATENKREKNADESTQKLSARKRKTRSIGDGGREREEVRGGNESEPRDSRSRFSGTHSWTSTMHREWRFF
jgi:hypothetical protein